MLSHSFHLTHALITGMVTYADLHPHDHMYVFRYKTILLRLFTCPKFDRCTGLNHRFDDALGARAPYNMKNKLTFWFSQISIYEYKEFLILGRQESGGAETRAT